MYDMTKFRQAFKLAGFRQHTAYAPQVFNDLRKSGIRRLKLWDGSHVFAAPQFAQRELEYQLQKQFGHRYLGGQFVKGRYWERDSKSFCVYLLA